MDTFRNDSLRVITPTPLEQATELARQLKKDGMARATIVRYLTSQFTTKEGWTDDIAARKIAEEAVTEAFKPEQEPPPQTSDTPADAPTDAPSQVIEDAKLPVVPPPMAAAIATKFVNAGGHVVFMPRRTKRCTVDEWEKKATNNLETALAWAGQDPSANVGIVGKQDGLWGLDDDAGLIAEYKAVPIRTYTTRTVSGGRHFIFRQNAESWAMGNISIKDEKNRELLSARVDNRYVVAAGSWAHPHNDETQPLTQYLAVDPNAPFTEAPQSLLDFIIKKATEYGAKPKAEAAGNTRHYYEGGRNSALASRAAYLRQGSADESEMREILNRLNQEQCVPPLPETEVDSIARSFAKYRAGQDHSILLNLWKGATAEQDEEPEEIMDDTETVVFPEFPVFPGALTDVSKALCPSLPLPAKIWTMVTYWSLMRSGLDTFGMEKHLQPRFYSILIMPKWAGKTASLNEVREVQKRIETTVGMNMGANDHRQCSKINMMPSVDTGQYLVAKFAALAKDKKKDKVVCYDSGVKAMLDPDEAADFFEKGRTTSGRTSTLFVEMLKLYAGNRTGSGTKSGLQDGEAEEVDNAHFAVVCGTQVKKYPQLWIGTGSGNDGLRSRFTQIGINASKLPTFQEPSDEVALQAAVNHVARLAQLPGQNVQLTEDGKAALTQWWESVDGNKDSTARVLDIVKQLLIVLTVVNLPEDHEGMVATAGKELVDWATLFGDFMIAVRDRVDPNDSWSHIQAMENEIIGWYKKHAST